MKSTLTLLVVPIIFFPLLGSIHCISNGPPKRRGVFAVTEEYPPPPPPPLPKLHYGPKPPTQIFVSKLSPDEHLAFSPSHPPHHHHRIHPHRGPPHIHTHVHNSPIPSHAILPPSPAPHSIQLKVGPPTRGGHGPPIPTIQSQGPPQIHFHGPLQHGPIQHGPIQHGPIQHGPIQHGPMQHGPPISHGPFGPPSISSSSLSSPHHFTIQHHGPPRDLLIHNRPIHHSPPPPPSAPTPPPPPAPPQPPKPFASWKPPPPPPTFRAPAVKESFHASPSAIYQTTNHFSRDDEDKGPIHTIPAPNLSLSDRPAGSVSYHKPPSKETLPQVVKSVHSDHTPLEVYSVKGYQVIEDSTAHKPGQQSYFAPDPDPSIPAPRVPPTNDPYSIPSNGQQPLDLIIQQHNEKQNQQLQQLQHLSSSLEHGGNTNGNSLTAQDLFNIFNTINQQQLHVIPPASDSDTDSFHNHPHQDVIYNSIQQHLSQPQDFQPQFQTFNYEEQSQQSPHGSDSYPLGASNIEYKRAVGMQESMHQPFNSMPKTTMQVSLRNSITTQQQQQQQQNYENAMANLNNNLKSQKLNSGTKTRVSNYEKGVINNHVDNSDEDQNNEEEEEEEQTSPDTLSAEDVTLKSIRPLMYTTLPNKKAADTLANLAAAGLSKTTSTTVSMSTSLQAEDSQDGKNNHDMSHNSEEEEEDEETGDEEEYSDKQENSKTMQNHNNGLNGRHTNNNQNNNVQLQKAIQIYETSYFDQDIRNSGTSSSSSSSNSNSNANNGGKVRTTDKDYQTDNDDDDYGGHERDASDMEESETQGRYKNEDQSSQSGSLSYGSRIRPKRN